MKPTLHFLSDSLAQQIIDEAFHTLCTLGIEIQDNTLLSLLAERGATVKKESSRVIFTEDIINNALKDVPSTFCLYDIHGHQTHDFSHANVHFTPGSSALHITDKEGIKRKPMTADYIQYVKLMTRMDHIASQSTAFVPDDVNEQIADSYRLYLSLMFGSKPVVTGTFSEKSFDIMKSMQIVIRGSEVALAEKPLTIFTCCPNTPFKWTDETITVLTACAKASIPIELVSVPMTGFISPVTLAGTLILHTVENLSGLILSQIVNPGTPVLYGGCASVYDMRHSTMSMGAVESMMLACGSAQIGQTLGLPTQAYIALSDSAHLDAQAGMETGMGAVMAATAGISNISGPGIHDFLNSFSLEKLILDNESCAMALRAAKGIEPKEDFPAIPLFEELLKETHLLISDHTRRHFKKEILFPGPVIDRSNSLTRTASPPTLMERAHSEVRRHLHAYEAPALAEDKRQELMRLMKAEAARHGQEHLPNFSDTE